MPVRLDKPWIPLTPEHIAPLPGHLGVYQLADAAGPRFSSAGKLAGVAGFVELEPALQTAVNGIDTDPDAGIVRVPRGHSVRGLGIARVTAVGDVRGGGPSSAIAQEVKSFLNKRRI